MGISVHGYITKKMLLIIFFLQHQTACQQQNFQDTLAQLSQIQLDTLDIEEIMFLPQPEPHQTIGSTEQKNQPNRNCSVTQSGCTCLKNWSVYEEPGVFFEGCANPDLDPTGLWCQVDVDTCEKSPAGQDFDYCVPGCQVASDLSNYGRTTNNNNITIDINSINNLSYDEIRDMFDFYNDTNIYELGILNDVYQLMLQGAGTEMEGEFLEFCNDTRAGCKCQFNWSFEEEIFNGCNNPDNDPLGLWCIVDLDSCDSTPKGANFGDTPYDYCQTDCPVSKLSLAVLNPTQISEDAMIQSNAENFTAFQPIEEQPLEELALEDLIGIDEVVDCKFSRAGCKCLEEWIFSQETYSGCANPDMDSGGTWCMIELGTCTNGDAFGANLNPPFDYCHPNCNIQFIQNEQQQPPQESELYYSFATSELYSSFATSDCEKSMLGCTCQQNWEYKGKNLSGCANPDNDPLGLWCAVEEGCSGQVTQLIINGVVTDTYFDYCQPGCVQLPIEEIEQFSQSLEQNNCDRTLNGCQCQPAWEFGGEIYSGCANPDDHDKGDWCEVLEETCKVDVSQLDPIFSQNMIVAYADNCQTQCTDNSYDTYVQDVLELASQQFNTQQIQLQDNLSIDSNLLTLPQFEDSLQGCSYQTIGGCTCRDLWTFEGQQYNACQNPDNDLIGNWCMIHEDQISCPSAKEMKDSDGRIIDYFDYCFEACPTSTESSTTSTTATIMFDLASPPSPPPTPFTPCSTSQSGCKCKSEWMYDGNQDNINMAYFGCATTLNDDILPWCQIEDITACEKQPRSVIVGDERGWDYCAPQCAPPTEGICQTTLNGCQCGAFWEYDGIVQNGCTRADADKQFSWCVVDVSSCSLLGTSGQIPGTNEYWDICDTNC